jgi:hypothetical protein
VLPRNTSGGTARSAELYDYNCQFHHRTLQLIKSVLDPKDILTPGKQGIWPVEKGAK